MLALRDRRFVLLARQATLMERQCLTIAAGATHLPGFLGRDEQAGLLAELRAIMSAAPLFRPTMPRSGRPFSVRMTNCGRLGWVSDTLGYRYQATHPVTGTPWPAMPERLLSAWRMLADFPHEPEACLVNVYDRSARMGLHQDRDEADFAAPVLSISLGDTGIFRVGGTSRGGKTTRVELRSGDAFLLAGPARLAFHGIDRILPGTSDLLPEGGRINLTLRRVSAPRGPERS
jgi:alkylated DNA repair protein (DNA oxidative demethylase)